MRPATARVSPRASTKRSSAWIEFGRGSRRRRNRQQGECPFHSWAGTFSHCAPRARPIRHRRDSFESSCIAWGGSRCRSRKPPAITSVSVPRTAILKQGIVLRVIPAREDAAAGLPDGVDAMLHCWSSQRGRPSRRTYGCRCQGGIMVGRWETTSVHGMPFPLTARRPCVLSASWQGLDPFLTP